MEFHPFGVPQDKPFGVTERTVFGNRRSRQRLDPTCSSNLAESLNGRWKCARERRRDSPLHPGEEGGCSRSGSRMFEQKIAKGRRPPGGASMCYVPAQRLPAAGGRGPPRIGCSTELFRLSGTLKGVCLSVVHPIAISTHTASAGASVWLLISMTLSPRWRVPAGTA